MAKGLWLDSRPQRAWGEWGCAFGTDHIAWCSSQCLVSWWANSILVNERDVLRFVLARGCHICLHVALLAHTMPPCSLSIWGTDLQRISCRGIPNQGETSCLHSDLMSLLAFFRKISDPKMSQFRSSNQRLLHWWSHRCNGYGWRILNVYG